MDVLPPGPAAAPSPLVARHGRAAPAPPAGRSPRPAGRARPATGPASLASIAAVLAAFLLALTSPAPSSGGRARSSSASSASRSCRGRLRAAERRASEPLFPLALPAQAELRLPHRGPELANFAYLGGFFLTPLLLEYSFGYSETGGRASCRSARPLVFSLIAPFAGYLAVRVGERTRPSSGPRPWRVDGRVRPDRATPPGSPWSRSPWSCRGSGLGVASRRSSATAANEFAPEDLGTAAASQQLMNQLGTVAGIQVMETVQASRAHGAGAGSLLASFHVAYLVGGVVACSARGLCGFVRRGRPARSNAATAATGRGPATRPGEPRSPDRRAVGEAGSGGRSASR